MTKEVKTIHIEDYCAPAYTIPETRLDFEIFDNYVRVCATLNIEAVTEASAGTALVLNGERLKLLSIAIDGKPLPDDSYSVADETLTIENVPAEFVLTTEVEIDPYNNTWLEGIYKSGNILCSQNEPEGFRKITYYLDRPDVMSIFSVKITADKKKFPYLLSNGNKIKEEELNDGRQLVEWHDPFPKPSYLFAFVAGDFARVEDSFTTMSGREVAIQIYVDHGNEDKVSHTIDSLKRSMKWDEETFGLEYDLDLFMIVAVDAFNMGAMENKGLNIFNSACALANPDTATDYDYLNVESIVAHEYFHNWTGDRITLRDWFQLTLKEGLTVYRDGEYTADTYSRSIKRIESASGLRSSQFVEDAGPNAHPIQPQSYKEINNFYTATVYSKGAEVIRMVETMLGKDGFRRGMDRYVELFDGKAITTEDFICAMEDANGADLRQFRRWYNQAGTPVCTVNGSYDEQSKTFTLNVKQSCMPTADGSPKEPFYFPMIMGLIDSDGKDISLHLVSDDNDGGKTSRTLIIDKREQNFVFTGVDTVPIPSLFRKFSAPVKVEYKYTRDDLMFLLHHDSDSFNRYDASQRLALGCLLEMTVSLQSGEDPVVADDVLDAYGSLLGGNSQDLAFCAHALVLPSIEVINQELTEFDFKNTFLAREAFKKSLVMRHSEALRKCYDDYAAESYSLDSESVAKRRFRNLCLDYLSYLDDGATELAAVHFHDSDNMTDRMDALRILCVANTPERDKALTSFMERYKDDFNVINKWFGVQASAIRNSALYENVCALAEHPLFDSSNPNRFRSIYGAFAGSLPAFHDISGRGYRLIADITIEIDKANSQVAAGLGKAFKHYANMPQENKEHMRVALEKIVAAPGISTGLLEIVTNTLKG
jgi:aminopeptidase N